MPLAGSRPAAVSSATAVEVSIVISVLHRGRGEEVDHAVLDRVEQGVAHVGELVAGVGEQLATDRRPSTPRRKRSRAGSSAAATTHSTRPLIAT